MHHRGDAAERSAPIGLGRDVSNAKGVNTLRRSRGPVAQRCTNQQAGACELRNDGLSDKAARTGDQDPPRHAQLSPATNCRLRDQSLPSTNEGSEGFNPCAFIAHQISLFCFHTFDQLRFVIPPRRMCTNTSGR